MSIEQLYIRDNEIVDGPYDMMAVIRKVRNGSLTAETLISATAEDEPVAAGQVPEIKAIIDEEAATGAVAAASSSDDAPMPRQGKSFFSLIFGVGLDFLKNSLAAAIYSGVFMLIWIMIGGALIYQGSVVTILVGIVLSYFLMGGYLFGVLRYVRGNPVSAGEVITRIKQTWLQMMLLSLILGMLMLPGVVLVRMVLNEELLVIGLPLLFMFLFIIMTFFAFAPLLVVEKHADFWDAICESTKVAKQSQNIGNVFGLIALNFILLFAMPIVLPMTMGALSELYDDFFLYS